MGEESKEGESGKATVGEGVGRVGAVPFFVTGKIAEGRGMAVDEEFVECKGGQVSDDDGMRGEILCSETVDGDGESGEEEIIVEEGGRKELGWRNEK